MNCRNRSFVLKKETPSGAEKVVSGQENWRQIGRGEGRQTQQKPMSEPP